MDVTPNEQPGAVPAPPVGAQPAGPARILVADDDAVLLKITQARLAEWGYDVVTAVDGTEAWEILSGPDAPRLAILDWVMPGLDGPSVCAKVRSLGQEPYMYIILLTGRTDKEDIVEGMSAGADDYVTKPFDEHELHVRIRAGQRILDLQEQLRDQATHDALTGLRNRRAILDVLGQELNRGRRANEAICAIIIDLDHFKRVNDTHGHLCGDTVLREAAARMSSVLRSYDAIGRYGGEEFLVVLGPRRPQDAGRIAERIRMVLAATPVRTAAGPVEISASLGVAVSTWEMPVDPDKIIQAADRALYRAKETGRNRVVLADYEDFLVRR